MRSTALIGTPAAVQTSDMTAASHAPARPVRVLLVEDERLMAELLVERLSRDREFEVCGIAGSAAEAVRLAQKTRPDLVVMDHRLSAGTGVDATRRIRAALPKTRVVMLTAETAPEIVRAAIAAGAVGYVPKHAVVGRLIGALHAALRGEAVLPADSLAGLATDRAVLGHEHGPSTNPLSRREREVLGLLAEGLDSKAIASRLGVSYHTVREHAQRVVEKLGARSRLEAVARARETGLL
jgi:DNA-binding NarL/FixJ family response regulator